VRLINGYLILLLAFAFREGGQGALDFGVLVTAAGAGYGVASFISPWLEHRVREEPMVVAALALEAGSAFMAAQGFSTASAGALAAAAGIAWGLAKFGFDGLLQRSVPPNRRGQAFTRAETLFQLAWVVGAIIPVVVSIDAEFGMTIAGIAALAVQTGFVAALLVEPDRSA
jgi:predicted MFS family arabinose efflux permease